MQIRHRFGGWLTDLRQDAWHALRQMRQAPGFSIAAVLMLAIGLGLVSGAYTVVNGFFIRGWAVPDNARVFRADGVIAETPAGGRISDGFSYAAFKHIRAQARSADYVAFTIEYKTLGTSKPTAVYSAGLFVSDNFLDVVQIPIRYGPGFSGTKADQGARVVLSDRLWRTAFNGDPGVVGRSIWVSGASATVVGITAPGFGNLAERAADFMIELSAAPLWEQRTRPSVVTDERACCIVLAGRMKPDATMPLIREELNVLTSQYRQATAQPELAVTLRDTRPVVPSDKGFKLVFGLVGAAVLLVWGLTCANVGNLFLARSLRRDREIAVRLALGASRGRLIRQLLAEGLMLAGIAGAMALGLAAGVPVLMEKLDGTAAMFAPDFLVAAVAALATVITCLLVALAPALQATRMNWQGAGRTSTVKSGRMREVVLAVQIAVATVLVLSATLIGRGITQASDSRADFALHSTTAVEFQYPSGIAEAQRKLTRAALLAAVAQSGEEHALSEFVPATENSGSQTDVRPVDGQVEYRVKLMPLSRSAFQVLEIPLLAGRPHDDRVGSTEAVINDTLARRLAPDGNAIGKVVELGYDSKSYTIVGITRDAHLVGLGNIEPLIHTISINARGPAVLVRSTPGLRERMTALAKAVDPSVTVRLTPLSEAVKSSLNEAWVGAAVAGGLGTVALVLAVIGVFGVFSYLIEERQREIGIRLALGATKRQVRTALARACRRPVVMGVAAGLGLSMLAGIALRSLLFGLSPIDPISYAIVSIVLLAAAITATAVPVRRALRVDPAVTLRAE